MKQKKRTVPPLKAVVVSRAKVGRTAKLSKVLDKAVVTCQLVVTRTSGDREHYLLAEVPDLRYAIEYRRRLLRVPVPVKLGKEWAHMERFVKAHRRQAKRTRKAA